MLFNAITVFGLVAAASAIPHGHLHSKKSEQPAARGMSWLPRRQFSNFGNSISAFGSSIDAVAAAQAVSEAITILQLEQQALDQIALEQEIALTQAIQLQLESNAQVNLALDNIRVNTFNNLNSQINTVAVVVTPVIDARDQSNLNTRYLVRQIQSNPSNSNQAFVVIQEASTITISNNIPSGVLQSVQASSTGLPSSFNNPSVNSYTPGAALNLQTGNINLLPLGSNVPNFANAVAFVDPAIIVQPNQQAVVEVLSNSNLFSVNIQEFSNLNSAQVNQILAFQALSGVSQKE